MWPTSLFLMWRQKKLTNWRRHSVARYTFHISLLKYSTRNSSIISWSSYNSLSGSCHFSLRKKNLYVNKYIYILLSLLLIVSNPTKSLCFCSSWAFDSIQSMCGLSSEKVSNCTFEVRWICHTQCFPWSRMRYLASLWGTVPKPYNITNCSAKAQQTCYSLTNCKRVEKLSQIMFY